MIGASFMAILKLKCAAMTKPFDALYAELEKNLTLIDRTHRGPEKYIHGIDLLRDRIAKLRVMGGKFIRDEAKEIEYFRNVWPAFYSGLLLFIHLHPLELNRSM